MNGINNIIKAIRIQRMFPEYLNVRWSRIAELLLKDGKYSVNELSRFLDLNQKEMQHFSVSLYRLKYIGRVRKYGGKFQLNGRKIRHYQQKPLSDFL